jgi:predicted secreted Zn-dependent protease
MMRPTMRTLAPHRVVAASLALALAAVLPVPALAQETEPVPAPACAQVFAAAAAFIDAVQATGADATPELRAALLDVSIAGCAGRNDWLTTAPEHPVLLGGSDPSTVLGARCSAPESGLAGAPACAPITFVARPKVVPKVKGAQRTRTYPIVGRSPDELFTQMQLNGSARCPTHALACTLVQPRIQPLVTTGGTCRVIGIRASLAIEAVVPRWTGPKQVPTELAAWWRKAAKRIGDHEAVHVRIANQHLAKLKREIVGRSCSSLQTYVNRWSRQLTAAQDAFDRKDATRPWPPYDGPLP